LAQRGRKPLGSFHECWKNPVAVEWRFAARASHSWREPSRELPSHFPALAEPLRAERPQPPPQDRQQWSRRLLSNERQVFFFVVRWKIPHRVNYLVEIYFEECTNAVKKPVEQWNREQLDENMRERQMEILFV